MVGQAAAHTITHRAYRSGHLGSNAKSLNRRHQVSHGVGPIHTLHQLVSPLGTGFVVRQIDIGFLTPEDIRGNHDITIHGVLISHGTDMGVDTPDFLNDYQAWTSSSGWQ